MFFFFAITLLVPKIFRLYYVNQRSCNVIISTKRGKIMVKVIETSQKHSLRNKHMMLST